MNSLNEYVIGVDIGATKSHLALFDTAGTLVDLGSWGPLNHEVLPGSFAQFEEEFGQFVRGVLSKNGVTIEQVANAVLGVAGVDTAQQHEIISKIVTKLRFQKFTLVNDAFLGVFAGNPAGTGICAINGTGCTLAGINREGRTFQIGGVGFVSADYGGGDFLGEKVVSAVYSELFRRGAPTCMTAALFKKFGISDKYDFVDKINGKIADGTFDPGSCSRILFEAVREKDQTAAAILRECAESYAAGISRMIEELNFSPDEAMNIVFAGSIFVKGEDPFLLDTLQAKIKSDNPAFNFKMTLLRVPPVAGAVIRALYMLNGQGDYYEKVSAQLQL